MQENLTPKYQNDPMWRRILEEGIGTARRQELIKLIEKKRSALSGKDTKLITYITKFGHPGAMVQEDDTKNINDLLMSIGKTKRIELMIHSAGGLSEAAKKIIFMCREYCEEFVVVVPDAAKSAATMIALGSDSVVMSTPSELGPIDPQYLISTPQGQMEVVPAWSLLKGYEKAVKDALNEDGTLKLQYYPILASMNMQKVAQAEAELENARKIGVELLKVGLLKNTPEKADEISEKLASGEYPDHAQLIRWNDAVNYFGANSVEKLESNNELWLLYWELYLRSAMFVMNPRFVKLFESNNNSLNIQLIIG